MVGFCTYARLFMLFFFLSCKAKLTDTSEQDPKGNDTSVITEPSGEPTDDVITPVDFWTEGPQLPECTDVTLENSTKYALSGVLLLPEGVQTGHVVYDSTTGIISCVGDSCDVSESNVVCTEGVISAGIIDTHNHMQYNALAPWQHDELFTSRYQWQSYGGYFDYREAYDGIKNAYKCDIGLWAEMRTIAGGGTSVVGSSGGACIAGLVRNLDESFDSHQIEDFDMHYSSGRVTNYDPSDGSNFSQDLNSGELASCLNHVAEGIEGQVTSEIDHMFSIGLAGTGFVHATDATIPQLAQMRSEGTTIIWSPRSNLDLYAQTTPADIAMNMGVSVALGPDWTWSGSANPVREMRCAQEYLMSRNSKYNDHRVWMMGTSDAARSVGLDGILGTLEEGMLADISIFSYSDTPYKPLIEADPLDTKAVIIQGKAIYGTSELIAKIRPERDFCEEVDACGETRTFCVRETATDEGYADIELSLTTALSEENIGEGYEYAKELFGVFYCEDTRFSCDISLVGENGDEDGDGITDEEDSCLSSYNPLQGDFDNDGVGDACDVCPLVPNSSDCRHDIEDVDDDGIRNLEDGCPYNYDPDQNDGDGDGTNDACDLCPEYANPNGGGCPSSIVAIRNPEHPEHPNPGESVLLSGVVTGIKVDYGFFLQDPNENEYAGILIYGNNSGLNIGDEVTLEGIYEEYYGMSEIKDFSIISQQESTPIEPVDVSACDVATDGAAAEKYEGMLLNITDSNGSSTIDVTISNVEPDEDYGEFQVEGCLRVDDGLCTTCWTDYPEVGTVYNQLIGILNYTYSNHKLQPRQPSDME